MQLKVFRFKKRLISYTLFLYKVHTNVVLVSTKGSTIDRKKHDRYQKKKELKMVADAASERNLTGSDLIVITDYISIRSNLTNDFEVGV